MYPQIIILVHLVSFNIQQLWLYIHLNFEWTHLELLSLHSLTKCLAHTTFTSLKSGFLSETKPFTLDQKSAHIPLTLPTLLPIGRGRKRKRDSSFSGFHFSKKHFPRYYLWSLIPVLSLKYFDLFYLSRDLCSVGQSPHLELKVLMGDSKFLEVTRGCNLLVIKKAQCLVQLET